MIATAWSEAGKAMWTPVYMRPATPYSSAPVRIAGYRYLPVASTRRRISASASRRVQALSGLTKSQ